MAVRSRLISVAGLVLTCSVLAAAPVALASPAEAPSPPSAPCYNGITPLDPYANICSFPFRPPRVRGSAPDQTALLNCSVGSEVLRAQCLSQFVNGGAGGFGGFGGFSGVFLGPGSRP
jgi:hypothetical protein